MAAPLLIHWFGEGGSIRRLGGQRDVNAIVEEKVVLWRDQGNMRANKARGPQCRFPRLRRLRTLVMAQVTGMVAYLATDMIGYLPIVMDVLALFGAQPADGAAYADGVGLAWGVIAHDAIGIEFHATGAVKSVPGKNITAAIVGEFIPGTGYPIGNPFMKDFANPAGMPTAGAQRLRPGDDIGYFRPQFMAELGHSMLVGP